jgi:hypothetical protein
MRRPTWETILSMMRSRCASSTNAASARSILPLRSTNTWSWRLTMTSVIESSFRNGSSGP